tara:strand:+ start:311 stop:1171 length:861 start_codon:yes stop_codon:yes gene_type:complete
MFEIKRGGVPAFLSNSIKQELIQNLGYSKAEVAKLKPQQAIDILDKNGKVTWIEPKHTANTASTTRTVSPYNVQDKYRRESINVDKAKDPRIRHKVAVEAGKMPGHSEGNKVSGLSNPEGHTKKDQLKYKNTATHKPFTTKGVDSVKPKSHSAPRRVSPNGIMNKFKGMSPLTKFGMVAGAMMIMANNVNSASDRYSGTLIPTTQRATLWSREGAYIPEKYSRGYDAIKEHLTDFGSRVHLSKTVMKALVSPKSSTRHATVRTTRSVTNSNLSLELHKKAIQHHRF